VIAPLRTVVAWCAVLASAGCASAGRPHDPQPPNGVSIGVATIDITPEVPIRLTGYGARPAPTSEIRQRLHAKALAFSDARGRPAVLITSDLIGIPRHVSDDVARRLEPAGVARERLAVSATHTHTGPMLAGNLPFIFSTPVPPDQQAASERYTRQLADKLERVARDALADRRPARLSWTLGRATFAANRRVLKDGKWAAFGVNPEGPVDHDLPLLAVHDLDGRLRAVLVSYACHATTLGANDNFVHGDWPGAAQSLIETRHPGTVAMVAIGAGADSNPNPRGSGIPDVERHARQVADEVDRLLSAPGRRLAAAPDGRFRSIELKFSGVPRSAPYAVQVWTFADDLAMVFLAGEVVVDYGLRLKRELDPSRTWVNAYTNDVPFYVASRRMIPEGGYEVDRSMAYYGHPAPLAEETEEAIVRTVLDLVPRAFVRPAVAKTAAREPTRERVSINHDWRFTKGDPPGNAVSLLYDVRPDAADARDDRPADAQPRARVEVDESRAPTIKRWILPTGNPFVGESARRYARPGGNWGGDVAFVRPGFDDRSWRRVDLPHDWAIEGPFLADGPHGGMGRLPSWGVAWYRKQLHIPASDKGRSIFLDVDGAMSYATVWLNGQIVGGWPYGYASWRVDLTPYVAPGEANRLAIRLDNPPSSSRWYPGGGIYRNVWLTKTHSIHVAHWGTALRARDVSSAAATVDLQVTIDNDSDRSEAVSVGVRVYALDAAGRRTGDALASRDGIGASVAARSRAAVDASVTLARPRLWGPPPTQRPHLYVAITTVSQGGRPIDSVETTFGVRDIRFDPKQGVLVNGERVYIKGVNQHHDLGALGAAFNTRAAERQLEILREMGVNAIRMAHNQPAPELLDLTDRMGFLVVNELFDVWQRRKTPLDFHLVFPEWHEQDTRAWVRRDRNHPSVIMWSTGNEVGEQYTGEEGAAVARRLREIVREEDPTRPTTASMNYAKPDMPFPAAMDVLSLNYQGEGIRDAPEYADMKGIRTPPLYPAFHEAFPDKVILSTENAAALSTRGEYLFPVIDGISAPVRDGRGGDPKDQHVSAYELYTAPFGSSPDKVFASLERHPYVAGGFVWSGWDYLGEPTPYYSARSSYYGVVDLAGFKKDRFYLYQAHWRPDHPMAHIVPHWTWPERRGQVTPVHVFTSGDEGELFLNGRSLGRKRKGPYEYRLRWDDVVYEDGTLEVIAYRKGTKWATAAAKTADVPAALEPNPDRSVIRADGADLSFVTVRVVDRNGLPAPRAKNRIRFTIDGPGEIVATDNGDPRSFVPFQSHERETFNGLVLVIVRAVPGKTGRVVLTASGDGLRAGATTITVR
jgi:beta-galactosidase